MYTHSEGHNCSRDVEENSIHDDHVQNPSNLSFIPHNQMKSRIENDRLTCHHCPPTDGDENDRNVIVLPHLKELHEEGQRVDEDPP